MFDRVQNTHLKLYVLHKRIHSIKNKYFIKLMPKSFDVTVVLDTPLSKELFLFLLSKTNRYQKI